MTRTPSRFSGCGLGVKTKPLPPTETKAFLMHREKSIVTDRHAGRVQPVSNEKKGGEITTGNGWRI